MKKRVEKKVCGTEGEIFVAQKTESIEFPTFSIVGFEARYQMKGENLKLTSIGFILDVDDFDFQNDCFMWHKREK